VFQDIKELIDDMEEEKEVKKIWHQKSS
jgi:hypothetical protein